MKHIVILILIISLLIFPASAAEITAPKVPSEGESIMPQNTTDISSAFSELIDNVFSDIQPDLGEAGKCCMSVILCTLLIRLIQCTGEGVSEVSGIVGSMSIASVLILNTNSMIGLGKSTIGILSDYGKLLLPVMTTTMAAQGTPSTSAALYTGTALFSAVLSSLIAKLLIPGVYIYLALAAAESAMHEPVLKNFKELIKTITSWVLKTLLTAFTAYMSISGVISGTTDVAALKAAKLTISTAVPVVGGILSDASDTILISASLVRNAAGLYGIFAILSVFAGPFIRLGTHYFLLKVTSCISSVFAPGKISGLIADFSTAMGLVLGMTGSVCLLHLVSTVCFLKGTG